MSRRHYNNTAQPTSLTSPVSSAASGHVETIDVVSTSGWPTVPFSAAIDRGTSDEEAILVTAVTSTTMTVSRGFDGTASPAHLAGASVEHCLVTADLDDANAHVWDDARDDHSQYLNAARVATYLPQVFSTATISAITTMTTTPTTHALISITSETYDRLIKVEGSIPLSLVPANINIEARILRGNSDVVAEANSYGLPVGMIPLQTRWIALAAGASAQFRFQVCRSGSGSGGSTAAGANYNNFSILAVREV